MSKIYLTHPISNEGIQKITNAGHEILLTPTGAEGIITILTDKINEQYLNTVGPDLKIIANCAAGFDNVSLEESKKRNIIVTNTPGVSSESVAEHAFGLILNIAHRITEADKFMRQGKFTGWDPKLFLGQDVVGKTLGIVGTGKIGSLVAKRGHLGHDMKIVYFDVKRNPDFEREFQATYYEKVEDVFAQADFITLHVPLLPTTTHLVNEKTLKQMKPTAYLINTSRGPVVDEAALVQALQNKQIAGAALDVFEFEPKLSPGLVELENVILTPHIASATIETRKKMEDLAIANLLAVLAGQPAITPVN